MTDAPARPVVARFCPSPTGNPHVGMARTALFSWAFARHHKGTLVFRIEDTDAARDSEESYQALLDALRLERVTLIGHSMGGIAAYLFAMKWPDRVERLVLEDPPPPLPRVRPLPDRPDGELDFDWDVVAPLHAQLADPAEDWQAGLKAITAPTLVVGGGLRSHVPQDQVLAMARRIAKGRMVTVPCGHEVHAARPLDFAAMLNGFLPGRFRG